LGLRLSESELDSFRIYRRELLKWNRVHNLTAIVDPADIAVKHFLDSLLFLRFLTTDVGLVYDLGTGPGFPGIPLGIVRPDVRFVLVEPARKKAAFLRHITRAIGLAGITVFEGRTEDAPDIEKADLIVSRALYKIPELQEALGRLRGRGIKVVVSKGPAVKNELKELKYPVNIQEVLLPVHNVDRRLIIWIT